MDKEYYKEYRLKNKEKLKNYYKQYQENNKEKLKNYNKQYQEDNKETIKDNNKKWREDNKEKLKKYQEENKEKINLYKQQPVRKMKDRITHWKRRGLVANNYEEIYYRWLNSKNCEICNHDYSVYTKSMDHNHDNGEFRNILCHSCNHLSTKIKKPITNTSGEKNIRKRKDTNSYEFRITKNKKTFIKNFKTMEEAVIFRDNYLSNL